MSFEDEYSSFELTNAEPPTPLETPTSTKFVQSAFATPRFDSSFFSLKENQETAKPSQSSLKKSRNINIESAQSSRRGVSGVRSTSAHDIDAQIASHIHHLSPVHQLELPPVDATHQLLSSPGLDLDDVTSGTSSAASGQLRSRSSMQTPPPTARSREKDPNPHYISNSATAMADPPRFSTPKVSRMKHPQTPGRIFDASPQLFTNLQFSPDLFQYGMSGPATAPVLPQSRLFWESDPTSGSQTDREIDPFFLSQVASSSHFTSSLALSRDQINLSHPHSQPPLVLPVSDSLPENVLSSPTQLDGSRFPAPFTASPRIPVTRAEDPSLFLSSPARRFGPTPQPTTSLPSHQVQRQPYHHQIEDSKREQASTRVRKPKERRLVDEVDRQHQDAHPPMLRPGIRRSVTHSGIGNPERHNHGQNRAFLTDAIQNQTVLSRPPSTGGRISPLKRNSQQAGLDRPPSRTRGSLTLTIDEHGRAKTVFTAVPESPDIKMAFDDEISESDASIESADFDQVNSRNTSFAISEAGQAMYKPAHLRPDSKSHSKNSSYSSAPGSSVSTNVSSRTSSMQTKVNPRSISQSGLNKDLGSYGDRVPHGYGGSSVAIVQSSRPRFALENHDEDAGDAQQALRALKKDRGRRNHGHSSHSDQRDDSIRSFHSSPPVQANVFDTYFNNNAMLSPTTITDPDLATPSTDRESSSSAGTRCVCNSAEHWGHMIQCESCCKWLHTQCVGLDPDRIPPVYVCVYCVQTPMRHGRVREPSRVNIVPASPLARKSGRHRG